MEKTSTIPYDMAGSAIANCTGEFDITVFLDNNCTFSIMHETF